MFRFKGEAYKIEASYLAAYIGDAYVEGEDAAVLAIIWDFHVSATRASGDESREARAVQSLAKVLDPEAFTFVQEKGVSMCVPK